jgi:hypothetical protein
MHTPYLEDVHLLGLWRASGAKRRGGAKASDGETTLLRITSTREGHCLRTAQALLGLYGCCVANLRVTVVTEPY